MAKLTIVRPEEVYIDFIATSPDIRSKGIGAQLIEFVRGTLGYKAIELEVLSKNPRAKMFYEREGFKAIKVNNDFITALQGLGKRIVMRWEKS
jgi:ribosomal protein S18 acetylase RimI-like enzyme